MVQGTQSHVGFVVSSVEVATHEPPNRACPEGESAMDTMGLGTYDTVDILGFRV